MGQNPLVKLPCASTLLPNPKNEADCVLLLTWNMPSILNMLLAAV
jgi:hypothetical protein